MITFDNTGVFYARNNKCIKASKGNHEYKWAFKESSLFLENVNFKQQLDHSLCKATIFTLIWDKCVVAVDCFLKKGKYWG